MKKLAIISNNNNNGPLNSSEMHPTAGPPPVRVHGVNLMLGGAMVSAIILVIFILCYCCHKSNKKAPSTIPTFWRDPEQSIDIFTVENQSWLVSEDLTSTEIRRPTTPGSPPPYELVVPLRKAPDAKKMMDDVDPPSYETAIKLQAAELSHN